MKSAADFVTQPIRVEVCGNTLNYSPLPEYLNFSQMQAQRRPIDLPATGDFSCTLANLGVSAKITLTHQGQLFEVLVNTPARANILKLISGYVPSECLANPLAMMLQEITEECLIHTQQGFLQARFDGTTLPKAYPSALTYSHQCLTLNNLPSAQHVLYQGHELPAKPSAYVHTPTASLQLVYAFDLSVPSACTALAFEHVDERLEQHRLIVERCKHSRLLLRSQCAPHTLYHLVHGQLQPLLHHQLRLSEAFAPTHHWQTHQSHGPNAA